MPSPLSCFLFLIPFLSIAYFYRFSTFSSSFFTFNFSSFFFFFSVYRLLLLPRSSVSFLKLSNPHCYRPAFTFFLIFLFYLTSLLLSPSLFLSYTSHNHRSRSERLNSVLKFKRVNASFHLKSSFNSTWDVCSFC